MRRPRRAIPLLVSCVIGLLFSALCHAQGRAESRPAVPEDVYRGELISYPGAWSFLLGKSGMILVSDQQLEALADPDALLNLSLTRDKQESSLRQVCERAKAAGHRTLVLAFDHFFSQYRPGQAGPRRLMPDMDEYVERIAAVSRFAQQYGLGLELSLLSPLEIGAAYARQTGESGVWLHYRKGLRDPMTGAFSVQLWQQRTWTNNKGPIAVADAGVRVFAFRENPVHGTPYRVVDPKAMVEVSDVAKVEHLSEPPANAPARRIRVYGTGRADIGGLNRVLVVQQYKTPEMDYFSDRALPYLTKLIDRYADAGVKLNGLYADEMHIQQDWNYHGHLDDGEFAMRYASPGFVKRFADRYGAQYRDFAKYMIYFAYGQEDFANDLSAKQGVMHVFGASPEDIRRTALFRSRYYHLLQDGVVDLFAQAKRHAEQRMGHRLEARAHATWAESPTCDYWRTGQENMQRNAYEYTSNFVWSNTVQQAASACHDYFKWGDFLTGNGNDHTEGGFADRDYLGLALACSTGILNEVPYSYAAHWGMPAELSHRRSSLVNVYGTAASPPYAMVQDMQHRDVDVLMLYPLDLVAVEERFGSWMTQYGYANLVTQAKLLERGRVSVAGGAIEMAGRRFTTLVATFEPFPSRRLLVMMRELAEAGGRVIWSGPPPVLSAEGGNALADWQRLVGADYTPARNEGLMAPGKQILFEGGFKGIAPQVILTDFLVDHIYPVAPRAGTEVVARVKGMVVGTRCPLNGGGTVTFLGFRPRDDQSRSLGYEGRWWFEILSSLGAYPPTGRWKDVNDNTEYLSRTTDYLACRFPNRAVAIARHFRDVEEDWPGGFARDAKQDEAYIKRVPPPTDAIDLRDFRVNGHTVTYAGRQAVTFRVDARGHLIAFAGAGCRKITIDGCEIVFADQDLPLIAWAPVANERRVDGGAVLQIMVHGSGTIRLPAAGLPDDLRIVAEGRLPGSRGDLLPSRRENGAIVFTVTGQQSGHGMYGVPQATSNER
jgi:hypothetical protein